MKYLAIMAILCLILSGASFAGNVTMTEVITGGNLTLTMPNNFSMSPITIGGNASQNAAAFDYFQCEDSRGTGAGWNLCFQINQFQTSGTPGRFLSATAFSVKMLSEDVTCIFGQDIDGANGPLSLVTSYTNVQTTPVEAVHALSTYGMGKYGIGTNFRLNIGASRYAGIYTAALTATLNNVP